MFACLQVLPREMSPLARVRAKYHPAPPRLARVNLPAGAPFFCLEVHAGKSGVPWDAVERAAGRLRTRILPPVGVCLPPPVQLAKGREIAGLRVFEPKRLPAFLSLRAAQQVLRGCETPARDLSVALVDPKGLFARALEPLVPLTGSLRVYCPDFSLYRAAAALLLERYGATLILSDSPACFAHSDIVVAPELSLCAGHERGLVFSQDVAASPSCRVVRGVDPILPAAIEKLRPPGIDRMLFACALFELCGAKDPELLRFDAFCLGVSEERYSIAELAALVDRK
ncbi:MAG: hypothetical protein LBC83_02220 [Oscillospiraceae bacterium]|jgi:hypothetical protein|nr:hypothetical protein [Oscillospiraceae bacterium]